MVVFHVTGSIFIGAVLDNFTYLEQPHIFSCMIDFEGKLICDFL